MSDDWNMVDLVLGYNIELIGKLPQQLRSRLQSDDDPSRHPHRDLRVT